MERIQCTEMTVLIGKVRRGEDEEEGRSCERKLQWSKVQVKTVEIKEKTNGQRR